MSHLIVDNFVEHKICLKFCVANGISYAASLKILRKAFERSCLSKIKVCIWFKNFKCGQKNVPHSGRLSMAPKANNRKCA